MRVRLPVSIPFAAPSYVSAAESAAAQLRRIAGPPIGMAGRARTIMNEASFHIFYRETAPRIWSYIRRASGDASLADDILQETFYRFLRADVPPMEQFQMKAYLYRTAGSLLSDHWRRSQRERHWSFEWFLRRKPPENIEQSGDAMALFQTLKPREQTLLWLAYVEGFDHREIAAALQVGEKSIRVLLFRARGKLTSLLQRHGIGPGPGDGLSEGPRKGLGDRT